MRWNRMTSICAALVLLDMQQLNYSVLAFFLPTAFVERERTSRVPKNHSVGSQLELQKNPAHQKLILLANN